MTLYPTWGIWMFGGMIVFVLIALGVAVWMFSEYFALKGHFNPSDDLIGQVGQIRKECSPHQKGKIYVAGAYWDAISEFGTIREGEDAKVTAYKEKFLIVQKVDLIPSRQV